VVTFETGTAEGRNSTFVCRPHIQMLPQGKKSEALTNTLNTNTTSQIESKLSKLSQYRNINYRPTQKTKSPTAHAKCRYYYHIRQERRRVVVVEVSKSKK